MKIWLLGAASPNDEIKMRYRRLVCFSIEVTGGSIKYMSNGTKVLVSGFIFSV